MKFPTYEEMAQNVAEKALDEYEYKGRTIRQWIEIIYNAEHGTNLAEVGTDVPDKNVGELISRQAAINAIDECYCGGEDSCGEPWIYKENAVEAIQMIEPIPSAQPERTCVNCGRTVNNGGWYADGGTRCPIEEHYALPKDGYCHLWEKRNVTDDDYPERRTDERSDRQTGGD